MAERKYTPKDHYVYAHYKATTGEIFYIGKGKGDRAWQAHISGKPRNKLWRRIVSKHGFTVEIIQDGLQEWAAFELECQLIALYGRRDLGLGSLANMTDGGEGASGQRQSAETKQKKNAAVIATKRTAESKAKSSESQIKSWANPDTRAKREAGLKLSNGKEEVKAKRKSTFEKNCSGRRISESTKKRWGQPEFREKFNGIVRQPVLCVETGVVYPSTVHAYQATGVHHTNISRVARNVPRYKTAGGFHWEYVSAT